MTKSVTRSLRFLAALCALSLPLLHAQAQPPANRSALSIPQIMEGQRFTGYSPDDITWGEDSRTVYFTWNPTMDTLPDWYSTNLRGDTPTRIKVAQDSNYPKRGSYNKARTHKVIEEHGDIAVLDLASGQQASITQTVERESNPVFAANGRDVLYLRGSDLYLWEKNTGKTTQLTNFQKGAEKSTPKRSGHQEWLYEDQLEWIGVLAERKAVRELTERRREADRPKVPRSIYAGDKRVSNVQASPNLRFVTFALTTPARDEGTKVPDYVTETGYAGHLSARSKVGAPENAQEMYVYDRERDTFYIIGTEQIPGIRDKPAFLAEYHQGEAPYSATYDKARAVYMSGPTYSDSGQAVVVVRSTDNKDRWIMALDLATGTFDLLDRQRDEAWIGGPGIGWGQGTGTMGWLPGSSSLWFQSEETGFSHLYAMDVATKSKRALTRGNFEVLSAKLSTDGKTFFITANAEGPHEHHFYKLPAAGGDLQKITKQGGGHEVSLSPDEKYLAIRYSYSNKPWELYLMENKPGAAMKQVTDSRTAAFKQYPWREPEIVKFDARDGGRVPARLYRPAPGTENKGAVIFVHGAGYLQNVHSWWSSYFREYMFHNILVDNGYTVLDIDYRGSAGYGRDWRTAIYRHMGGKDLDDQVDGARFLVADHGIDAGRVGIYGGSYGGFITLMGLFTSPGTFRSGAALRSVADWAHYNHPYTANILNTPIEDSAAYRRSSPIYHAEGLQDRLLMLHGMIDTNVHFQDVVRLSQRLIELGKDDWELAVFPLEDHGFQEPSSWTDEYKRIFKLFQETLR